MLAQLYIHGQCEGPHFFVVRIRDEAGRPIPGIRIQDNGPKMGLNGASSCCLKTFLRLFCCAWRHVNRLETIPMYMFMLCSFPWQTAQCKVGAVASSELCTEQPYPACARERWRGE